MWLLITEVRESTTAGERKQGRMHEPVLHADAFKNTAVGTHTNAETQGDDGKSAGASVDGSVFSAGLARCQTRGQGRLHACGSAHVPPC